jgi:hypothetical protein
MIDINNIWGPDVWRGINAIVRFYPENPTDLDKIEYRNFLESFKTVLPCNICKEHYTNYLSKIDWDSVLFNRFTIVKFVIDLHNDVNKRNGKPILEYHDASTIIFQGGVSNNNSLLYISTPIIILLVIILIRNILIRKN